MSAIVPRLYNVAASNLAAQSPYDQGKIARCVSHGTRRDRAARGAIIAGRPDGPVDARRQPDQVAPRAYDLVFRTVSAQALSRWLSRVRRKIFVSVQFIYVAAGPRHSRPHRGMLTRPDAADISAYRALSTRRSDGSLLESDTETFETIAPLIELGLNHEQQHQELLLTDILHALRAEPDRSCL